MVVIEADLYHFLNIPSYQRPRREPDWGERMWSLRGRQGRVYYRDVGNSYCDVVHIGAETNALWIVKLVHGILETEVYDAQSES